MINRVNMDGVKPYGDSNILPKGGYVMKILGVTVKQNRVGQYLELSCDVCEGEYKDFFANDYRNQSDPKKWHCNAFVNVPRDDGTEKDGWTKRAFATFIDALEQSNSGYHFDWDETKMKGLIAGGLFVIREYEGQNGDIRQGTTLASWTTADKVRNNKFKLPKDKLLKREDSSSSSGFTPVTDDDLPF